MLTKPTEYAIRTLVYIAVRNSEGLRPGFKEIAREIDSPEQYTAKILQTLTRSGLIHSLKGRGGGFFFGTPAGSVTLFDVIKITEGEKFFMKCGFGLYTCDSDNPCPLHDSYKPVRQQFYELVQKETIQSLAVKIKERKATLNRIIFSS